MGLAGGVNWRGSPVRSPSPRTPKGPIDSNRTTRSGPRAHDRRVPRRRLRLVPPRRRLRLRRHPLVRRRRLQLYALDHGPRSRHPQASLARGHRPPRSPLRRLPRRPGLRARHLRRDGPDLRRPARIRPPRRRQSQAVEIWAVSSTCNWVIEEGVQRFDIPPGRVLAARVAVDSTGLATDTLLDVPTDEGKVASLARVGLAVPHAVFGNSIHDAAMLAIARSPQGTSGAFAVNPTPALVARAAAEHWPIYYPASTSPGAP